MQIPFLWIFFFVCNDLLVYTTSTQPSMIWLSQVQCTGSEQALESCPGPVGWGVHDCVHLEDAAVCCKISSPLSPLLLGSSYLLESQTVRLFTRSDLSQTSDTICGRVEVCEMQSNSQLHLNAKARCRCCRSYMQAFGELFVTTLGVKPTLE
jgi:hypothetical protein